MQQAAAELLERPGVAIGGRFSVAAELALDLDPDEDQDALTSGLTDLGVWFDEQTDGLPEWLAPFNGRRLVAFDDEGAPLVLVHLAEGRNLHQNGALAERVTTNDNGPAILFYRAVGWELVAVHKGAIAESRRLKPEIPEVGLGGVPIEDELEFELRLSTRRDTLA